MWPTPYGYFIDGSRFLRILELGVVDRLVTPASCIWYMLSGGEALDVAGAARQPALGQHLGAALRIAGLVLHDLPALRHEERLSMFLLRSRA